MADAPDETTIKALREELSELRAEKDASGCCPFNSAGDKDIYGRKFSLPVSTPALPCSGSSSSSSSSSSSANSLTRIARALCTD
tara:strand:+ start:1162 stop:1413 length:252 start_codon:yes stop_codon:yes gene_type:complete